MFILVNLLGRLIVRLYLAEAKALNKTAKVESKMAVNLAYQSRKCTEHSLANVDKAAKVAADARQLARFFCCKPR